MRTCAGCGVPIAAYNKSGYCAYNRECRRLFRKLESIKKSERKAFARGRKNVRSKERGS